MLHKAKHKLSQVVNVNLKVLKFTTNKVRLIATIIGLALLIKFLFAMGCSINLGFLKVNSRPLTIKTEHLEVGTQRPETIHQKENR